MNKWKIRFWICFGALILVTGIGLYSIIDQGVTLTYLNDGYENTNDDLNNLVVLINNTDLTKTSIKEKLKSHPMFEMMDFNKNEVRLNRLTLYFKDEKLSHIKTEWR